MPLVAFLAGRILQAIAVAVFMVALVTAFGVLFYDVTLPADNLPAVALVLAIGAATFCALGLALAGVIPSADAGPAVVNGSMLPLMFISNVYIPMENSPQWVRDFASLFPVVHFANALHAAFSPFAAESVLEAKDLAVIAAWGVIGIFFAARYFSWEPRK
jgi:ABC-2 type transport system permease protein